jgi:hypothetical protein
MLKTFCLILALLWTVSLWPQVVPSASGGSNTSDEGSQMIAPPPVSGQTYPSRFGGEARSNHLAAGLALTAAYNDNLLYGGPNHPTSDETYSVLPTLALERETPRQVQLVNYGVGFTVYQHTSELNSIAQNASVNYQYHLSKYSSINVQDSFVQNSNVFNNPNPISSPGVSGSPPAQTQALIVPFENQIANTTSAGLACQYARNAMIGGGGSYSLVRFGSAGQGTGLYNSDSTGATFFYVRRLTARQYLGGVYRFSNIETNPVNSTTQTNTIFGFYTFYLTRQLTFSVMGGPQHFNSSEPPNPETSAWTPSAMGSIAYRTSHANIAASYTRIVTGGGGLVGAYHSNAANLSARWQFTRTWSGGVGGGYFDYTSATPIYSYLNEGGHSWTGDASLQHSFGERIAAEGGYSHFHQNYTGIPSVSAFPNSNRVYVSVHYEFTRPLGR